jgi:hypothetical protein
MLIYSNHTDPGGPAMTWSMFSIGFGDLGDDATAAEFFSKGYLKTQTGPFLLWHEQAAAEGTLFVFPQHFALDDVIGFPRLLT